MARSRAFIVELWNKAIEEDGCLGPDHVVIGSKANRGVLIWVVWRINCWLKVGIC